MMRVIAIMITLLVPICSVAQDARSAGAAGSEGGTPKTLNCPAGKVLTGVTGSAGTLLDRIQIICSRVGQGGNLSGAGAVPAAAGGTGGRPFTRNCPRNFAVSAFRGHAGNVIDQLVIGCRKYNESGRLSGPERWLPPVGGHGGRVFPARRCPDNLPGLAFHVRSGLVIDRLELMCGARTTSVAQSTQEQHCFGAIGMQCSRHPMLTAAPLFCRNGKCPVNAGSWEHDECCWRNPNGVACVAGPLDEIGRYTRKATGGGETVCGPEWDKAVSHSIGQLNWWRDIDFLKANRSGRVVFNEYCAPAGTILKRADRKYCCSRSQRALDRDRDRHLIRRQRVANSSDPALAVCR